jgi:hypothetical protein
MLIKRHPPPRAGRTLFLFSNEERSGFFAPLAAKYDVRTWRDFAELLEVAGLVALSAGQEYEIKERFLLYLVEQSVAQRAQRRMETFNHLTELCRVPKGDIGCRTAKPDPKARDPSVPLAYVLQAAG